MSDQSSTSGPTPPNAPAESASPAPRRGRPPVRESDETRRLILDAASEEFLAHGYARSSVSSVARRAGVSTRTIYEMVSSKPELFRLAAGQRIATRLNDVALSAPPPEPGPDALRELIAAYAALVLNREAVATNRIIIAERDAFPALSENYRTATAEVSALFDRRLTALRDAGLLTCADPAALGDMLRNIIHGMQRQLLLGLRELPTPDELDAVATQIAALVIAAPRAS